MDSFARVRSATSRSLRGACAAALRFLAPQVCPGCGRESAERESSADMGPRLCGHCDAEVAPPESNRCARCAAPMGPFLDPHVDCIYCRGQRFAFHRVVRLGVYEGLLQELCRASKRPAQFDVATALVEALWSHEHAALRAAEADLVIPVAHHWTETFARPERLSESVGRQLAGRLRVNFSPFILTKTRRTPRQSTLPVTHRLTNLKGAFRVPRRFEVDLRGRRVLLADDVLTTGATADEVSRVLRSAGAAEVVVAVLARGLGRTTSVDPPRGEQPRDASAR